jgi:hypothetical protein
MSFRKATRKQAKLRLALCGPAGSGKTYSALQIAQGLAPEGKIALVDTEAGSGELYADIATYDVAPLTPPYTPERYIQLIREAETAGYDVLIIDSLSHAWAGAGGVLELHDRAAAASRSGNSFAAWREVTPQHNALVDALLGANLHIVTTMRTKTAYDMVDDGKGHKRPVKIGLAPVQRDGLEYEFTVVLDLSVDGHVATATKDRTSTLDGQHFIPSQETGEGLREWLGTGVDPVTQSKTKLRALKGAATRIEAIPHLENWWKKHRAEVAELTEEDRDALIQHCAQRKDTIAAKLAEREHPAAAPAADPVDETDPRARAAALRERASDFYRASANADDPRDRLGNMEHARTAEAEAEALERDDAEAA